MEQEPKKVKKIILITMLFLLIILVATYVAYSYYAKNIAGLALKKEVLENVKNNDLSFFLNQELYESMIERMEKNNFEIASDITLSTTMENNMFSELDLSKFQFHYDFLKNNQKTYHKLQTQYAANDFIIFDFITTPKQFAMKSDEIVNKYVGINPSNFQNTVNQLYDTEMNLFNAKKIKDFIIDREEIRLSHLQEAQTLQDMVNLVGTEILPENISKKENVVVTINSEQIATTEYTISLNNNHANHIFERYGTND